VKMHRGSHHISAASNYRPLSTLIADGLSDNTSPAPSSGLNSDRNARSATSSSNAATAPAPSWTGTVAGPILDHIIASSTSASRPGQYRSHAGSPTSRAGRAFSPRKARKTEIDNDRKPGRGAVGSGRQLRSAALAGVRLWPAVWRAATGRRGSRLSGRRLVAQRRAVWGLAFAEQGRDDCHRLILREPKQQN
jgi:hypothetical protein